MRIAPHTATRRRTLAMLLTLAAVLLIGLALAGPAVAQTDEGDLTDDDQVVLHGRLHVAADETVGTALIFNGPATIDGTVRETVVVFNGDLVVSGNVREDVVVFNGDVTIRSSAEIGGDLVSQATPNVEDGATIEGDRVGIALKGADAAWVGFASRMAWWIAYSLSTLVLGLLLVAFAPRIDGAITRAARDRMGASIGLGVAWFFLLPIVAVVLLVTVVGIPLGLFILLALALIYTVGYVAGAHALGRFVMKPPASPYLAFIVGWGIARVVGLVPVLGGLSWLALAIFGLGVLVVAARSRPTAVVETAPAPPPPAPVATG